MYKYDVGISYASEDELYVGRVIRLLKKIYSIKTFYAPDEKRRMIGEDLLIFLNQVYRNDCRYVAMFVSEHYISKEYPRQEAAVIKIRQQEEGNGFIIPVVFNNAQLNWLHDITYLSGSESTESEIAYLIKDKVKGNLEEKEIKTNEDSFFKSDIKITGEKINIVNVKSIDNSIIQPRFESGE